MSQSENIHPIHDKLLKRSEKEARLGQQGIVLWLFGLSGSGKSTIVASLERKLHDAGYFTQVLDGDNVRSGLNRNLGFSDEDREENIRRVAEVAKLFCESGVVTLASFITPFEPLREKAKSILGNDSQFVYIKCSFETCAERDPKGLYAKMLNGEIEHFTGKDSVFEEPKQVDITIDTETESLESAVDILFKTILPKIQSNQSSI